MEFKLNELTVDLLSENVQDEAWLQRFVENSRKNSKLLIKQGGTPGFSVISENSDTSTLKGIRFLPMERRAFQADALDEGLLESLKKPGRILPDRAV